MGKNPELGAALHFYQPSREVNLPSGESFSMWPEINETIYQQSYRPIMIEGNSVPDGIVFSFFNTLREWIKKYHPEDYRLFQAKVELVNGVAERLLGDPFFHVILPFLDREDKDILIGAGREAMKEELGVYPLGLWLPETAVDIDTLKVAAEWGYKYVVLKDYQVEAAPNKMVEVNIGRGRQMAVLTCDNSLSGSIAFQDWLTTDGDLFLNQMSLMGGDVFFATDGETFGHHKPDRDKFLKYAFDERKMRSVGLAAFDIRTALTRRMEKVEVREMTSWSCPHGLGRWNGKCDCDNPSERTLELKRWYLGELLQAKRVVKQRLNRSARGWQDTFRGLMVANREYLLANPVGFDYLSLVDDSEMVVRSYKALTMVYWGLTSCGWFFGGENRIETQIPARAIEELAKLL